MEKDIEHIKKALNRNRLAVFSVVAFLALITYLLIVVSQGVTEQASISTTSMASEAESEEDFGTMMPSDPSGIWPPTCNDYSDYIEGMQARARRAAAQIKYKVKINGQVLKGTCDRYVGDIIRTPGTQAEPLAPIDTPSQCEDIRILYRQLEEVEKFMQAKCKQCPGEIVSPTPAPTFIIPRPTQNQAITLPGGSVNDGGTQLDPSTLNNGAR